MLYGVKESIFEHKELMIRGIHKIVVSLVALREPMEKWMIIVAQSKTYIGFDFRRFFVYVLDVKWQMNVVEKGPNATIKRDASGYVTIDSTKFWQTRKDRLVLPQQCEQVCIFLQMCFMYIYI